MTNIDEIDTNKKENRYLKISNVNKFLYFGSYEHPVLNGRDFSELKIDIIINCCKNIEYESKIPVVKFNIVDNNDISLLEHMDTIINLINKNIKQKKNIYVHCSDGNSITPTLLIYYLMIYHDKSYYEASEYISKRRTTINICDSYINLLNVIDESRF